MPVNDFSVSCTLCEWRARTDSREMSLERYTDHMKQFHGTPNEKDLDYLRVERIAWGEDE